MKNPLNITGYSTTSFAAALSLDDFIAKDLGVIKQNYSVTINNEEYSSGWLAFLCLGRGLSEEEQFEILVRIFVAKLTQYPILLETITRSGGINWLEICSYYKPEEHQIYEDKCWEGTGSESTLISALISAYRQFAGTVIDEDDDRDHLNRQVSYDPISRQLFVKFQNIQKAREWGIYLNQKLFLGEGYSIENSSVMGCKFELVVPMIDENAAKILAKLTDFTSRPHANNPRDLDLQEGMPCGIKGKIMPQLK